MSFQSATNSPIQLLIVLEILTESADEADLAGVSAVGRDIVDELQIEGYRAQFASTGQRGGDVLVDVITTVTQIAANVWADKDGIERVIADLSGLVAVWGGIVPIAKTIVHVFKKRAPKSSDVQVPITFTIEIDGTPVSIEAADLEQAEAVLTLAQRFHSRYPATAAKVTTQSKVKVRANIPKAQRRKRR